MEALVRSLAEVLVKVFADVLVKAFDAVSAEVRLYLDSATPWFLERAT